MSLPLSPRAYAERVYAGVLGKMIGVYLGRPIESWSYEQIMAKLGEITYYVHEKCNVPLLVTDDDLSGTFTFLRALPDYGNIRTLTPEQIGQTWLNYIIEGRTILWWGGLGNSTEHTAYLRLKQGIAAPVSGSIALNGKVVAEQIGSQIFIDGWAMIAPGDPALAADFARRAASVSHDGEAIYGAQILAAMEAQAFVEGDIQTLLDVGLSFVPKQSVMHRMIQDIRAWHAEEADWRKTRRRIVAEYGYDKFSGNCHIVPNHALIILGLLYGNGDFQKSLMIVNTSGWDTDCNSGNLGCLLGIKNGLPGLEGGPDWRGPLADRLYLPTADGGRSITDAVTEAYHIVNIGNALAGKPAIIPKHGARFHFELPGSLQGFHVEAGSDAKLENIVGQSSVGERSMAIRYTHLAPHSSVQVVTPTFTPPEAIHMFGYMLLASPTLYSGQRVRLHMSADIANTLPVACRLFLHLYGADDQLVALQGPELTLAPGEERELAWTVPSTNGSPVAEIGLELHAAHETSGSVYLDFLTWDGTPEVTLTRPEIGGAMWHRAWVDGMDQFEPQWPEPYRLMQNEGRGLIIQGTREWKDYRVSATLTPHMAQAMGIGACVQGMRRYYALTLAQDGVLRLLKILDGEQVLAESYASWKLGSPTTLSLQVVATHLQAWLDDRLIFDVRDDTKPLLGGGVALLCEEGRVASGAVRVQRAE